MGSALRRGLHDAVGQRGAGLDLRPVEPGAEAATDRVVPDLAARLAAQVEGRPGGGADAVRRGLDRLVGARDHELAGRGEGVGRLAADVSRAVADLAGDISQLGVGAGPLEDHRGGGGGGGAEKELDAVLAENVREAVGHVATPVLPGLLCEPGYTKLRGSPVHNSYIWFTLYAGFWADI